MSTRDEGKEDVGIHVENFAFRRIISGDEGSYGCDGGGIIYPGTIGEFC